MKSEYIEFHLNTPREGKEEGKAIKGPSHLLNRDYCLLTLRIISKLSENLKYIMTKDFWIITRNRLTRFEYIKSPSNLHLHNLQPLAVTPWKDTAVSSSLESIENGRQWEYSISSLSSVHVSSQYGV